MNENENQNKQLTEYLIVINSQTYDDHIEELNRFIGKRSAIPYKVVQGFLRCLMTGSDLKSYELLREARNLSNVAMNSFKKMDNFKEEYEVTWRKSFVTEKGKQLTEIPFEYVIYDTILAFLIFKSDRVEEQKRLIKQQEQQENSHLKKIKKREHAAVTKYQAIDFIYATIEKEFFPLLAKKDKKKLAASYKRKVITGHILKAFREYYPTPSKPKPKNTELRRAIEVALKKIKGWERSFTYSPWTKNV